MTRRLAVLATLLLLAALLVACGGGGGGWQAAATAVADATPSATLSITAKDLKFDKKALVVAANADVTIRFANEDSSVLHNVAIYRDDSVREKLFGGELFAGKKTVTYAFRAPAARAFASTLRPGTRVEG